MERKKVDLILVTIFWVVWKERNKRVFDGIDDVNEFDLLKNKWFQNLGFLLLGHSLQSIEDLRNLIDKLINM